MKHIRIIVFLVFIPLFLGCKEDPLKIDTPDKGVAEEELFKIVDTSYFNYAKGVENAMKKAQHIANIPWTPLRKVPLWGPKKISYYQSGHQYSGLPFSSVKEVDTYVGHNVSFYTFMSAVNNPMSKLYTEDLSKAPYHGVSCATYYGTVCSMSVNYALGIDTPFICRDYPKIGFVPLDQQRIEAIKPCDVLWNQGHTMMVYALKRDDKSGSVNAVTIFEVNNIKEYSKSEFLELWAEGEYTIMRYKYLGGNLDYEPNQFVQVGDEPAQEVSFNQDLCPDKGDRTCYRTDEPVRLDVLNPSFTGVAIEDGNGVELIRANTRDGICRFEGLAPGLYKARAFGGSDYSARVDFEVVDTNASAYKSGNDVNVSFSSENGEPLYMILCKDSGGKYATKRFSPSEIQSGRAKLSFPEDADYCYVKVAFRGKYGIITNTPILVKK